MYTREEASQVRKGFWTSFGQYMKPVKGAGGDTVNWLNYKTGVKHLYFRMDAEKLFASVSVEISHPDAAGRAAVYSRFESVKSIFDFHAGADWEWQPEVYDEDGREISRIISTLPAVNVYTKSDWPAIISFFKPKMIALDTFWSETRDLFVV